MPNRSNTAAVRKSAATISPTVVVVNRSLITAPVSWIQSSGTADVTV
jgi:hypothetical protein